MEKNDPIISALYEEIGDEKLVREVIEKHKKTGISLMSILREDNLLDEERSARVIATGNKNEFIIMNCP